MLQKQKHPLPVFGACILGECPACGAEGKALKQSFTREKFFVSSHENSQQRFSMQADFSAKSFTAEIERGAGEP